ncbi:MAG: YhjD/YihY/BrkB family envelope integrity protein [Acidimicrobiia bacterium]
MRGVFEWARDVQRRYSQIGGQALAGGIALYGFLALFALLVLAVAVLGFLSVGNEHLARDVTNDLGLTGDAARIVDDAVDAARDSRRLTTVLGVVGIVWLGTSFALTIAAAFNAALGVTARGVRERGVALLWLLGAAVLLTAAGWATALWDLLPGAFAPLVVAVTIGGNTAVWLWTAWILPNRRARVRQLLVPALIGAVALEVLKVMGAYVVPRYVSSSSELYGALGTVFALLLWLLVFGRLVVYVAVIEAKRDSRASR